MSKSKKASLTKAQKERKEQYDKCQKIYNDTVKQFTDEQTMAFSLMIEAFRHNFALDQCVEFTKWMDKEANINHILNAYIEFQKFQNEVKKTGTDKSALETIN
tara:strand:- start:230 stop:538 length:309 start_codon:yes stop_codon:yes gene_type:complete